MSVRALSLIGIECKDVETAVLVYHGSEINGFSVYFSHACNSRKPFAQISGNVISGHRLSVFLFTSVFQCNNQFCFPPSILRKGQKIKSPPTCCQKGRILVSYEHPWFHPSSGKISYRHSFRLLTRSKRAVLVPLGGGFQNTGT